MIQSIETTIEKLAEAGGISEPAPFIEKLAETSLAFGNEILRDLKSPDHRQQLEGGMNAAYLLALLGDTPKALRYFEQCLAQYHARETRSTHQVLRFVVRALEDAGVHESIVEGYRQKLSGTEASLVATPEHDRLRISHLEADMECATGDLNAAYASGRREQGSLYQRLGEHERAIACFHESISEDSRDWRGESSVPNTLSIIDSYLALDDLDSATSEFVELMKRISTKEFSPGNELPDRFVNHFDRIHPYFQKLGLEWSFAEIADLARIRLGVIDPKMPRADSEICNLTNIAVTYYLDQGDYLNASALLDASRARIKYPFHLSRIDHAELAVRAGDRSKAEALIKEELRDKKAADTINSRGRGLDLANIHLQLGNIDSALKILDTICEDTKRSIVSGSFHSVFEIRRTEIDILRAAIGDDSLNCLRSRVQATSALRIDEDLKLIEAPKQLLRTDPEMLDDAFA